MPHKIFVHSKARVAPAHSTHSDFSYQLVAPIEEPQSRAFVDQVHIPNEFPHPQGTDFDGFLTAGTTASWRTKWSWDDAHLETNVVLGQWPFGDPSGPGTGTAPELARVGAPPLGVRKHRFSMSWMPGGAHGHHIVARRAHLGSRFSHPQGTYFDGF